MISKMFSAKTSFISMQRIIFFVSFTCFLMATKKTYSQENEANALVENTFRNNWNINEQTVIMLPKHSMEFSIKHRFGGIGINKSFYKQFLGFDLPANIRFGFAFPFGKNCSIGIGRTKNGKTVDGEIKHLLFAQKENNKMPVSVALYFNTGFSTDDFLEPQKYSFFQDSITPFKNKFNHRLSYYSQIIIARKFGSKFSVQLSPSFLYRNLVEPLQNNQTFILPVSAAFKTGIYSSVLLEYSYRFNNKPVDTIYPLSIAYEISSASHIFQIVLSSTTEITENLIQSKAQYNYLKQNFVIGFNLKRTFYFKKKINR